MVDADSVNAQSLNVREIALRLDAKRFRVTLFYEREPDSRLLERSWISLRKLPARHKTARILQEMMAGHDVIAYVDYSPASYLFLRLPQLLRRGVKTVFHVEAPASQIVNPSRTLRFLYEGVTSRCDVYTAISNFIAADVHRTLGKKISHVLPVGVDTSLFCPPAKRMNRVPVILFAGTLVERKGPHLLVGAAVRLPNAIFRLVGAGRGGFEDTLRWQIRESEVKNVILEGPKSQSELIQIMRESDIFVLPSRLEGIPKVTLEAAATGLPCVVFRDYQTPSVVDSVTGFQVNNVEEMTRALSMLVGDAPLRQKMGAAASRHVEQFDWDLVAQRWQSAYIEIATSKAQ